MGMRAGSSSKQPACRRGDDSRAALGLAYALCQTGAFPLEMRYMRKQGSVRGYLAYRNVMQERDACVDAHSTTRFAYIIIQDADLDPI
jgi:hypothetical protein